MTDAVRLSKFLSYVLRHAPEAVGVTLDKEGWADVENVLRAAKSNGLDVNAEALFEVVAASDKKRFALSVDRTRIRAVQGHSTSGVNIDFVAIRPPDLLYHGTAVRNLKSIRSVGLASGNRHYVHLSLDELTAIQVGRRHGEAVVLQVGSKAMYEAGYDFYQAENGVWLTRHVPPQFLGLPSSSDI